MFMQLENPAVVQTQPFPHRVTALHSRIERADPGLIAMHQLSVDVHNQIAVSVVEFLKHFSLLFRAERGTSHWAKEAQKQSHGRTTCWMMHSKGTQVNLRCIVRSLPSYLMDSFADCPQGAASSWVGITPF